MSGRSKGTLVNRIATVQFAIAVVAIVVLLGGAFAGMSRILRQERDQALSDIASAAAAVIGAEYGWFQAPGWLDEELAEHRVEGSRLEAQDADGLTVGAVGAGPGFASVPAGECADQAGWRICAAQGGPYRILAGRVNDDGRTLQLFFATLVVIGLIAVVAAGIVARQVAKRSLQPLADLGGRLVAVEPGAPGQRVGGVDAPREIDDLARCFDDLLQRFDEVMARERRFAVEASHELKTPLTVIRGEVETIASGDVPAAEAGSRALASIDELIRIVDALLLLSRAQVATDPRDLEIVNLADIARHAAAGRSIEVRAPEEILVGGDEVLLGRLVANLLDNAAKHAASSRPVDLHLRADERRAYLRVRDHGPGFGDLDDRVFEPFFRAPEARAETEGAGLGLALVRAVARAHGGDCRIVAVDGPGACVEVWIPLVSVSR